MTKEYLTKANEVADNLRGAKRVYKDLDSIIDKFKKADSFYRIKEVLSDIDWKLREVDQTALSKAMAEAAIEVLKDRKEQVNKDITTFEEQFEAL